VNDDEVRRVVNAERLMGGAIIFFIARHAPAFALALMAVLPVACTARRRPHTCHSFRIAFQYGAISWPRESSMNRYVVPSAGVATVAMMASSGLWFAHAAPTAAATAPARIHFAGCVKPGVEAGCLIVESDGKTYNVTSAKAQLTVGRFAAGTGLSGAMSACMQGDALSDIVLDNPQPKHAPCVTGADPTASH
jgi:hypothetical protein